MLVFLVLIGIISIMIYVLNYLFDLSFFKSISVDKIDFMNIAFDSFKLIVFYYFIVAFIEETSKHFNFLQSSVLYVDSVKT
jgi:RsiW-degrading membrane proteinase PrsW (M82 family)